MALPCNTCGALIVDFDLHNTWHAAEHINSHPANQLSLAQKARFARHSASTPSCALCSDRGVTELEDGTYTDCQCKKAASPSGDDT